MQKDMTLHVFLFFIVYTVWCCGVLKATESSFTYIALCTMLRLHCTDHG